MTATVTFLLVALGSSPADAPRNGAAPAPTQAAQLVSGRVVQAKGLGKPAPGRPKAQARLMARRAAEVTAVRNLGNKLAVPRGGSVRSFRYVSYVHRADGSVEVVVEYQPIIGRK